MMSTLQTPDLHTEIEVFLVGWVALLTACLVFVDVLLLLSTSKSLHTGPVKCPTSFVFQISLQPDFLKFKKIEPTVHQNEEILQILAKKLKCLLSLQMKSDEFQNFITETAI